MAGGHGCVACARGRRHCCPVRYDGRPRGCDPQGAGCRGIHQHPDPVIRRQVRVRVLRPVSRSGGIHPAVWRPPQLPDGPRQWPRSHARNRAGPGRGRRHDHGQAGHALSGPDLAGAPALRRAAGSVPGERRVFHDHGGWPQRLDRLRARHDGEPDFHPPRRCRFRADVFRQARGTAVRLVGQLRPPRRPPRAPHAKLKVSMPPKKTVPEMQAIAKRMRREIIEMIGAAKSGHPGGSLSAVELVVTLYFDVMRHDPSNPKWPDRDRFILSKGHAAPVLYAAMAECGYTPLDKLNTLRKLGSIYQGHPDVRFIPSLEASTGSLGEGVSLALGMGLTARLNGSPSRTYVMLGDGENQEGQIWESAMFGAFHKVDNIGAIVDYNGIQLDGFVKDIMEVAPLAAKWRAFGWHTIEIDGHNFPAIQNALSEAE